MAITLALLYVALWIIFTTYTVMETLPWAYHDPTWVSVSIAIISVLIIIGLVVWVMDSGTTYDPYDY